MPRKFIVPVLVAALMGSALPTLHARGRQPDNRDVDGFPDYNRLEMRPKPRASEDPAATTPAPAVQQPTAPPALNSPVKPAYDEDAPQPAPKAVPLPEGASEPPMPDDIQGTLLRSTTTQ